MRVPMKFTLIELMVVIAIIAILASMLLPSLSRGRDLAKSIACVGNLKQLGLCGMSYMDAYNDYLPTGQSHNDPKTYKTYVYDFLKLQGDPRSYTAVVAASPWKKTIFNCPSNNYPDYGATNYSYGLNDFIHDPTFNYDWSDFSQRKLSSCPFPSKTMFFADNGASVTSASFTTAAIPTKGFLASLLNANARKLAGVSAAVESSTVVSPYLQMRHSGGAMLNILWLDGHAARTGGDGINLSSYAATFWSGR